MSVPLPKRPHRLREVYPDGPEAPSRIRVYFDDDPQARYFLDPERCVIVERDDGSLGLLIASNDSFVMEPHPARDMTPEEKEREDDLIWYKRQEREQRQVERLG